MGYTHRSLAERIEREGALRRGDPPNRIAERLGRSAGTPGRDRALQGGRDHDRALGAQHSATARAGAAQLLRDHGPSPWLAALLGPRCLT